MPALTIMAATAFFYFAAPILVPLVAAVTFAYVLSPAVMVLKRIKVPHVLAVLLVMAVGAVLLFGVGFLIVQQSLSLTGNLPQYFETVKNWLVEALGKYQALRSSSGNVLPALDQSVLEKINVTDFSKIGGYLFKGVGSVFSAVGGCVLIVLLTLFLLLDQQALRRRLALVLGGDTHTSGSIIDGINEQIRGFMLVKFVTTVGLAIVFTVGLLLFGVNYAYIWGPLAAVLNLIPYAGAVIGMIPPAIVAAIQTGGVMTSIWVLVFFEAVQLVESNVITPKLVGNKVNLNLLAVLLSTIYWGWLWGLVGVILAVPITAAVKVICAHVEPLRPIAVLLSADSGSPPAVPAGGQRTWR